MTSGTETVSSKYFCGDTADTAPAKAAKTSTKCEQEINTDHSTPPTQSGSSTKAATIASNSTKAKRDGQTTGTSRLPAEFFNKQCADLAQALLGQRLVHVLDSGERLAGVIVETEAYCGVEDKAAHSYQGKRTARTEAMFMKPGTAYVYSIYGTYCCMNISSTGDGCAVLLRAVEPTEGLEKMRQLRSDSKKTPSKPAKDKDLGNGPSKLCMALAIKKDTINQQDLTSSGEIWLEKGENSDSLSTVVGKRININYAEDWTDKPLRFYVLDNKCVSVRDKEAERIARDNISN